MLRDLCKINSAGLSFLAALPYAKLHLYQKTSKEYTYSSCNSLMKKGSEHGPYAGFYENVCESSGSMKLGIS